jgi:hypothetical protein
MGKVGTSRGGRNARGRLYYPGRDPKASPTANARKIQRDYPEPVTELNWNRSGASGGRSGKSEGEGNNNGSTNTSIVPIFHTPINVADAGTEPLTVIPDVTIYSGVTLEFTFERAGRWGRGTLYAQATSGGAGQAQPGVIVGDDPNVAWSAAVVSGALVVTLTNTLESGTADLNIAFTTTAYTRSFIP